MDRRDKLKEFIHDAGMKFQELRNIRKAAGWSQKDVADLMGVDQSRVSRWESGKEKPGGNNMLALLRVIDYLQDAAQKQERPTPPT